MSDEHLCLLQDLFPDPLLSVLHVEWHARGSSRGDISEKGGWVLCVRLEPGWGGVEEGWGCVCVCRGPSEVCLPFRVTSSCQECSSPARTDHVLDAPTLFLTRQGGSVAGFREWPWSARRLQSLSLVPRALLALWRPPSALTRTPLLQWDYNCFIGREKAQEKPFQDRRTSRSK